MTDTQTPGHDEPQPPFEGEPLEAPPLPVTPPVPLDERLVAAEDLAQRAITRAGYELTGYVLTHRSRGAKCLIDGKTAVWLPPDQHAQLLAWKRPRQTNPPEGSEIPPREVSEAERAMQELAMRLGLPFNSMVPKNSGWFVPGIHKAFEHPEDAIEAFVELIYTAPDATVYRPGKPGRASGIVITGNVVCTGEVVAAPPAPERTTSDNVITTSGQAQFECAAAKVKPPKPAPAPVETPQMGLF
jgi:hypothetical protein